jgi:hypothetical protein
MVRGEANHKVCANLEVPSFCGLNKCGEVQRNASAPNMDAGCLGLEGARDEGWKYL